MIDEFDELLDNLIHIKNFEAMLPNKVFCGKRPASDWGNPCPVVDWSYPTFEAPMKRKITCKKCLRLYKKRFKNVEDLSFKTFRNKDFSGHDFTSTSIIGATFRDCNLEGALIRSAYMTTGLDLYHCHKEGIYIRLIFSSDNPYSSRDGNPSCRPGCHHDW